MTQMCKLLVIAEFVVALDLCWCQLNLWHRFVTLYYYVCSRCAYTCSQTSLSLCVCVFVCLLLVWSNYVLYYMTVVTWI